MDLENKKVAWTREEANKFPTFFRIQKKLNLINMIKTRNIIKGDLDPTKIPHKIKPKKRSYNNKKDPKRPCLILAIQPLMHTAYIKFLDTNTIAVAPLRLLERDRKIPKKKLLDFF
ncbi:MAG: hypothetical protein EAX89_15435 [Candidatus Lokiarchaeota archaeon]|nr:hypothetical protein [Candidatus Lokiarchaeota archaeon]